MHLVTLQFLSLEPDNGTCRRPIPNFIFGCFELVPCLVQVEFANEPLVGGNTDFKYDCSGGTCFEAAWQEVQKVGCLKKGGP